MLSPSVELTSEGGDQNEDDSSATWIRKLLRFMMVPLPILFIARAGTLV